MIEEFLLQYYETAAAVPALIVVEQPVSEALVETLCRRRGARVEVRAAERGDKRRILELAARNAALALEEDRLKAARRRERRAEALDGLRAALALPSVPMRIECFDISNLQGTHSVASMVVFEAGVPKRSDYRRFRIRTVDRRRRLRLAGGGAGTPDGQLGAPVDTSPHESGYDASFAALPNLIVIDGGKGQLSATLEPLAPARGAGRRGDRARQAPRGGLHPGSQATRSCSRTRALSCNCSRASATRRTVSPSATTARGATVP